MMKRRMTKQDASRYGKEQEYRSERKKERKTNKQQKENGVKYVTNQTFELKFLRKN